MNKTKNLSGDVVLCWVGLYELDSIEANQPEKIPNTA